jgi:hypothetical protein
MTMLAGDGAPGGGDLAALGGVHVHADDLPGFSFDLQGFSDDAVDRGYIDETWYLTAIMDRRVQRPPRPLQGVRFARTVRRHATALLAACLGSSGGVAGCSDADPWEQGGAPGPVLIVDTNNYRASVSLAIPTVETASGSDLDICWDAVTSDLSCHGVDPTADVNNVALLRFLNRSPEQVEQRLAQGTLAQSELDGYLDFQPAGDATCASLSSLTLFGSQVDVQAEYTDRPEHTYLLVFARGTVPGVGALSMTFLQPASSSSTVDVAGNPGCGLLEFSANLTAIEPVEIPRAGPWVLDWSNLTRDGLGGDLAFERVDTVLVAFYADATVAELESQVVDLELVASSLWEIDHGGGHEVDLATARERDDGQLFTGFNQGRAGVWLLALLCRTCQSPAPLLLTILQPVAGNP